MVLSKKVVRKHIKKYDDRAYLDVKTILAELALEKDDSEMLKLSVLIGLIQSEVNDMNTDEDDSL